MGSGRSIPPSQGRSGSCSGGSWVLLLAWLHPPAAPTALDVVCIPLGSSLQLVLVPGNGFVGSGDHLNGSLYPKGKVCSCATSVEAVLVPVIPLQYLQLSCSLHGKLHPLFFCTNEANWLWGLCLKASAELYVCIYVSTDSSPTCKGHVGEGNLSGPADKLQTMLPCFAISH